MMNRFYSLNRSMSVKTTDHFPYLLIFSKSCNIFSKESKAGKELTLEKGVTTLGFSIVANQAIDNYILKYKLENLKTEKEKNSIKRLENLRKEVNFYE